VPYATNALGLAGVAGGAPAVLYPVGRVAFFFSLSIQRGQGLCVFVGKRSEPDGGRHAFLASVAFAIAAAAANPLPDRFGRLLRCRCHLASTRVPIGRYRRLVSPHLIPNDAGGKALFSSLKILQNFSNSPSHRIFRRMYEVLNIDKNKN